MILLRRLRGVLGTAALWSLAWGVAGAVGYGIVGTYWSLSSRGGIPRGDVLGTMVPVGAVFFGLYGALSGGAFALILVLAERRRRLADLSAGRIAAWGAAGGTVILLANVLAVYLVEGALLQDALPVLGLMSLLGAGCAAGSLALARRPSLAFPAPGPRLGDPDSSRRSPPA